MFNKTFKKPETYLNVHLTNFLKIYLDFCYYLCFSPFRLAFDSGTNQFAVRQWLPQKICCGLFTTLCYFWLLGSITSCAPDSSHAQNPKMYFNMFTSYWIYSEKFYNQNFLDEPIWYRKISKLFRSGNQSSFFDGNFWREELQTFYQNFCNLLYLSPLFHFIAYDSCHRNRNS